MTGQVYALASGKGGVGKTAVTANLGVTLRSEGHSVALVDADLGMANLTTLLNIEHETTLHDILAGEATVEQALTEEADGFALLPGTRDLAGFAAADPDGLEGVLEELAAAYEFVLVDTGGGLSYEDVLPLGLVDGVVLVTTPGSAAIGDTRKTGELAEMVDGHVEGVVVNRATDSTDAEEIAAAVGAELLGTIPEDRNVADSAIAGKPLQAYAPESPAARAYERLAAVIAGTDETAAASATEGTETAAVADPAGESDSEPAATEREDQRADEAPAPESAPQEGKPSAEEEARERAEESTPSTDQPDESGQSETEEETEAEAPATRQNGESAESSGGVTGFLGRLFR